MICCFPSWNKYFTQFLIAGRNLVKMDLAIYPLMFPTHKTRQHGPSSIPALLYYLKKIELGTIWTWRTCTGRPADDGDPLHLLWIQPVTIEKPPGSSKEKYLVTTWLLELVPEWTDVCVSPIFCRPADCKTASLDFCEADWIMLIYFSCNTLDDRDYMWTDPF